MKLLLRKTTRDETNCLCPRDIHIVDVRATANHGWPEIYLVNGGFIVVV